MEHDPPDLSDRTPEAVLADVVQWLREQVASERLVGRVDDANTLEIAAELIEEGAPFRKRPPTFSSVIARFKRASVAPQRPWVEPSPHPETGEVLWVRVVRDDARKRGCNNAGCNNPDCAGFDCPHRSL